MAFKWVANMMKQIASLQPLFNLLDLDFGRSPLLNSAGFRLFSYPNHKPGECLAAKPQRVHVDSGPEEIPYGNPFEQKVYTIQLHGPFGYSIGKGLHGNSQRSS